MLPPNEVPFPVRAGLAPPEGVQTRQHRRLRVEVAPLVLVAKLGDQPEVRLAARQARRKAEVIERDLVVVQRFLLGHDCFSSRAYPTTSIGPSAGGRPATRAPTDVELLRYYHARGEALNGGASHVPIPARKWGYPNAAKFHGCAGHAAQPLRHRNRHDSSSLLLGNVELIVWTHLSQFHTSIRQFPIV